MAFYGIPIEKKYPLNTEDEVRISITHFNKCPKIKRKILANNINKRLIELDMLISLSSDNDFINYIDKRYLADVSNDEILPSYRNMCYDITQIQHKEEQPNEYNRKVYEAMVKYAEESNDVDKLTDFLREGNEFADNITRSMMNYNDDSLIIMDIINHAYESLYLVSLQYNVSKEYVNKLLDDLEEMYVELHDNYMVKRKIFALNQYNSRCISMKTELNTLIARRTKDLLNGKFTVKALGKMSSFAIRYTQGNYNLTSYFIEKQNELKEYYTMQNKYFLSGFNFHKPVSDIYGDSYSLFETEVEIQNNGGRDIQEILKLYPKLTFDIPYSDMYRLQKKFKYIKQIPVKDLYNVTIVSINEGNIHFVTKKKNGDRNIFYIIPYDKLINDIYPICSENNKSNKITAMKVILKSEEFSDEDYNTTLESCTKF
ncbi:hypothetical protein [Romboutsia ilealis]|uniref:hypothetical protein n=1 Tax=Romboutsia ilealis TaxID=1115758 RepID=UPI00272A1C75|nr:hypothetical protein [Romboutsia ilealis]